MEMPIQVRQRGTLTLPAALREKYGIKQGDTYYLVDLDGVLVLTPMVPLVPELAREIERLRVEAGLSSAELLAALREERQRYAAERRADEPPAR
jgi:bifunctional DNA-binding transcriptional regulator/antitoxin component of YhaV-PrlF toxin-antitoxin module